MECLIVDDSSTVRKVIRKILEELKFFCVEAENGEVALRACQKKMPDLILLDWNMPVMNGVEFLKILRDMPGGTYSKVIFCTAQSDLDFIRTGIEFGADEYIMKPFDREIIASKLIQMDIIEQPMERY